MVREARFYWLLHSIFKFVACNTQQNRICSKLLRVACNKFAYRSVRVKGGDLLHNIRCNIQCNMLHNMLHRMLRRVKAPLPRLWRQTRVVALLKPGKDPSSPKSFRPISLLCHLYKLYERLILNRLSPIIEHVRIPEQAGFRPGKSCTAQVLNLTQHIEDGFETGKSPA